MRKEQIITSAVMCIVSILVVVGFTVAWYSLSDKADVTGLALQAAEQGDIRIALYSEKDTSPESEGKRGVDISELVGDDKYVVIGLEELKNIAFEETDAAGNVTTVYKIAPGTYGDVRFFVTPLKSTVTSCQVSAEVILKDIMGENGVPYTKDNGEISLEDGSTVNVYELAQKHIVFYYYPDAQTDPANPVPVYLDVAADGSDPDRAPMAQFPLTWDSTAGKGIEKPVTLYWKWYYEDPAFEAALAQAVAGKSAAEAEKIELAMRQEPEWRAKIDAYDNEDTLIGNHIRSMQLHFAFHS